MLYHSMILISFSLSLLAFSDIDECQVYGTCPQVCKNRKGGYDCECAPGYRRVGDGSMCEAEGENNVLMF